MPLHVVRSRRQSAACSPSLVVVSACSENGVCEHGSSSLNSAAGKQKKPSATVPKISCEQNDVPSSEQWASDRQGSHKSALSASTFEQVRVSRLHTFVPHAAACLPVHCTHVPRSQTPRGVVGDGPDRLSTCAQSESEEQGTHRLSSQREAAGVTQSVLLTHSTQVLVGRSSGAGPTLEALQTAPAGLLEQSLVSVHSTQPTAERQANVPCRNEQSTSETQAMHAPSSEQLDAAGSSAQSLSERQSTHLPSFGRHRGPSPGLAKQSRSSMHPPHVNLASPALCST